MKWLKNNSFYNNFLNQMDALVFFYNFEFAIMMIFRNITGHSNQNTI